LIAKANVFHDQIAVSLWNHNTAVWKGEFIEQI